MKRVIRFGVCFWIGLGCISTGWSADWAFDSAAKTISDGEWVLKVDVSGSNLTISGCNAYVGEDGHLDLSKSIEGGKVITSVGSQAFNNALGKASVVSVVLPETVKSFGNGAFLGCTNLVTVTPFLPSSVTSFGEQVFDGCKKLEGDLTFSNPTSLSLGWKALFGAASIRSVTITAPFTGVIPSRFAEGCSALKELNIPDTVSGFGSYAFNNCTNLTTVTPFFPASVTKVEEGAFYNCTRLEGDILLSHPTTLALGWSVFRNAASLHSITITTPMKASLPGYFASGCSALAEVHLPDTITGIPSWTFQNCTNLYVVTPFLPRAVATIGENCFTGSPVSGEMVLSNPEGLTSIGWGALTSLKITSLRITAPTQKLSENFAIWCSSLREVELPKELETINPKAFGGTALESITLPPAVKTVGDNAFGSIVGVKTVYFQGPKPTSFSSTALDMYGGSYTPYADGRTCFYVLEDDSSWDVQDPVGDIVPVTEADLSFFATKFPDSKKKPYAVWKISGNKRVWIIRYKLATTGMRIFVR